VKDPAFPVAPLAGQTAAVNKRKTYRPKSVSSLLILFNAMAMVVCVCEGCGGLLSSLRVSRRSRQTGLGDDVSGLSSKREEREKVRQQREGWRTLMEYVLMVERFGYLESLAGGMLVFGCFGLG